MKKYIAGATVSAVMAWLILGLLFGGNPVIGELVIGSLVSAASGFLVYEILKTSGK
jgi:hypothetical protein